MLESDTHKFKCKTCGTKLISTESPDEMRVEDQGENLGISHNEESKTAKTGRENRIFVIGSVLAIVVLLLMIAVSAFGHGGVSAGSNASAYVSPASRNIMRVNGLDVYASNGESITLEAFAKNYLYLLDRRLGRPATADEVAIGMESGNSLDGALHQFFTDENAIGIVGAEMQKDAA